VFRGACELAGRAGTPQSAQLFGHASSPLRETTCTRKASAAINSDHWVCSKAFRIQSMDLSVLPSERPRLLMLDIHTYVPVPHYASLESTNTLAVHRALSLGSRCSLMLLALAAIQTTLSPTCDAEISRPRPHHLTTLVLGLARFADAGQFQSKGPLFVLPLFFIYSIFPYSVLLRHSSFLTNAYHLSEKCLPTANHFISLVPCT
jgi:hypothetical protein